MGETREERVAAARARLAELAAKFLDRTRADVAALRGALGRLSTGDAAALGEIRHLAHRMAGTGATFGFEALSERASGIERLVGELPAGQIPEGQIPAKAALAGIAAAIEALSVELDALVAARG